ncbi:TolC family protein [Gilvimarinus sp. F26214L]|uniref:TolC family protein n=1 Tax=Gilvimarinus sp. DZF01 TaxID=3461371 RepID=UPI0040460DCB
MRFSKYFDAIACVLLLMPGMVYGQEQTLSLQDAITGAIAADPWLAGSRHRQAALLDEATAAAALPNPRLSLGLSNFPTDDWDFGREAMTQATIGVSQAFPRGESRALAKEQKRELARQQPFLRIDRKARVTATVTQLWLEVLRAQQSIHLIESDRALFEQLVDVAEASYGSAHAQVRQQDVIRAQLELTRLDDRLTALQQEQEIAQRQLSEWIGESAVLAVEPDLPVLEVATELPAHNDGKGHWKNVLVQHPAVAALEQEIASVATGIELAEQAYKPEWGLSAQYGYRDEDPLGNERSDLLSVGVNIDLPLFTENKQDKEVSAAVSRTEAIKTERTLLLRRLGAELDGAIVQLQRLQQRESLYREQLLPQMQDQAEAALSAYNHDAGDFAEAVRARIAELNAKIEALAIRVAELKTIAQLNYLLAQAPQELGAGSEITGEPK